MYTCSECGHKCKNVYMIDSRYFGEVCATDYLGVKLATFRKIKSAYEMKED